MSRDPRFTRADSLFDAALDLPAGERADFLARECAGDAELRALVQRLLDNVDAPTNELATGRALEAAAGVLGDPVPDLTGESVDRYRVVREIGRGGMGVVYEARDDKLERTVAIKVLGLADVDERIRERFLREARAAAALNHPNVVGIHDAGEVEGRPYLVMEFVPGRSLDTRPPRDVGEALVLARQICGALEHAHGQGLVHRDLKPGNVMVSEEADRITAKLADMGIALARGSARVTRTGAITGTPTYMAPEQASGQAVDGRADLYSLGVMLYAWAAGRPPFEGDNALAVVSQHINAPVVPPRAFNPDLPAGLEPVIMRLLAKEPAARFASASEVRAALDRVGTLQAEETSLPELSIAGLARGCMVGRERELAQVQSLWRSAVEGRSHMALVSGEPGVGKTRLAREVAAAAQIEGAPVLAGGCYENEATTPYLPFVEAFRRLVHERTDDELRELLGDTAAEIARLAPEVEARLGPFPDRAVLTPQEERLRLFDHVARLLSRLAAERGLLLFLDDLQWADHGSLALLHFLMRQLAEERVLFLGTYREVELDRAHPLSKALNDWNRERLATRIRLDRLRRDDTARMVRAMLGQSEISEAVVASVHGETEGNPFFVEEIVKALVTEGGLVREGSAWQAAKTGELQLPQSVKAAIGSRLERISEPCTEVLRTAAVLGKHFEFGELASVAGKAEDELIDALDEATSAQLIVAGRGESFAFTHDKIREVLYDELNPIRRRRLHARIAEGLEALAQEKPCVSVEDLAYHFCESGDDEKGLRYARDAADAAKRVFAFAEALEMLTRARECAEALDRPADVVSIDEAMGDAAHGWGDLLAATGHYERALAATSNPVLRNVLRGKLGEAYVVMGDPRGNEHARVALAELDGEVRPRETAVALMVQARYLHLGGRLDRAAEIYREAADLARPVGDPSLLIQIDGYLAGTYQHLAEFEESDGYAVRCLETGQRHDVPLGKLLGLEFLCENAFYRGRWDDSVRHGEDEERLAREVHAGERYAWSHIRVFALIPLGRLEEAGRVARRALAECERIGEKRLGLFMRMGMGQVRGLRGDLEGAIGYLREVVRAADDAALVGHRITGRGFLCEALLRSGLVDEAAREAATALDLWRETGSRGVFLIYGTAFADALIGRGDVDAAVRVLDDHEAEARRTSSDHRLAQNLRSRAVLAERRGDRDAALAGLGRAIGVFETTGGRIDLARSLADRARLRAGTDPAGASADRERARELAVASGAVALVPEP